MAPQLQFRISTSLTDVTAASDRLGRSAERLAVSAGSQERTIARSTLKSLNLTNMAVYVVARIVLVELPGQGYGEFYPR